MKLKQVILLLSMIGVVSIAAEPSAAEIRKAYFSSYELEKQQRYADASHALDPVASAYPQSYTVNYRRGWLAYLAGNFTDAKKFYGVALTQYPASLEVRKGLVLVDAARRSWKEVEQQCRIGRKTDYYNLDFCYWQAVALRVLGQADAASKVVEEITVRYPTNVNFLTELARIRLAQGKKDQVLALLESVYILDPLNQEAVAIQKQMTATK